MCGSSVVEVDLDDLVEVALGVGVDLGVGAQVARRTASASVGDVRAAGAPCR